MHTILHKQLDGGVDRRTVSASWLAIVTGPGFQWSAEQKASEIEKFIKPQENGAKRLTKEFVTEYITAISEGGLTEDEAYDLLKRRVQMRKGYTTSAIVDDALLSSHLTSDRTFRDAIMWDDSETHKCRCDMPTARGIHMDVIRRVRNAELAAKDITFMKAVEAGDTSAQSTIATEKQTLRDIPQTFDLTTDNDTPEELKEKWPTELPARE